MEGFTAGLKNIAKRLKWIIVHTTISLKTSIWVIFSVLFLLIVLVFLLFELISFGATVRYASKIIMQNAVYEINREFLRVMQPAQINAELSARLIQDGLISTEMRALIPYTYFLLNSLPLANGTFYGDENGSQVYSARQNDGSITTYVEQRNVVPPFRETIKRDKKGNIINDMITHQVTIDDPRTRVWYQQTKQYGKSIWSSVFRFVDQNMLGVVTATPVFEHGIFRGAFGVNITLNYLSHFIASQRILTNGFSFILDEHENLIAYPHHSVFRIIKNPQQLNNVHRLNLPLINASLDQFKKTGSTLIKMRLNNENYYINYSKLSGSPYDSWLIGVIIPEADFTGWLYRQFAVIILLSIFIIGLGIFLFLRLASTLIKPVKILAQEAEKIRKLDFSGELAFSSQIKEVLVLKTAINNIETAIKQFQKYIPKTLVRQLVESGQEITPGGERKRIVVLFSDIKGFTTIAEQVNPGQLMLQLCEYLEVMTDIIISHQGTIDKYIGDSIMAFWGAPLRVKNPADQAAQAALECQQRVTELNKKWQQENKPQFFTRIGIHSGEAIVGNVGSSERLNYTAIGDTINIASRLEQLNKSYETEILISEAVQKKLTLPLKTSYIGTITVRGRVHSIKVYQLLS